MFVITIGDDLDVLLRQMKSAVAETRERLSKSRSLLETADKLLKISRQRIENSWEKKRLCTP
jgi:hypothetical protein